MKLLKYKQKRYWDKFVDLKILKRNYNENEKNRKKFFAWKWKDILLKASIIW